MISFREMVTGLRELSLDRSRPIIVHAALSKLGEIRGGPEAVLAALLQGSESILMPAFTYKTMLIPETGPENNAIKYGTGLLENRNAEFFDSKMPVDPIIGSLAEYLRRHPRAARSIHPILSFTGIQVEAALAAQTLQEPLVPIRILSEQDGYVLLFGVDHTSNTSIHYAEKLAGRKQFTRWALTRDGVRECPGFPGCSNGFEQGALILENITRRTQIGDAQVRALPLRPMIELITQMIHNDPQALLCGNPNCERCSAVRKAANVSVVDQNQPGP